VTGRGRGMIRRAGSLLMIIGGLLLAYPFWSAAYTRVEQGRLAGAYNAEVKSFTSEAARTIDPKVVAGRAEEHMRALAKLFARSLKPGRPIGHLIIPRLHFNRVVLQGVSGKASLTPDADTAFLRSGPVHYGFTALPGAGQPFAIAGHRTTYAAPFYYLDKLRRGDTITVQMPYGRFTYSVARIVTVLPTNVSVLYDRGYGLVLTTCTPRYSASHRLIVMATLVKSGFH
jgi:sortase A